MSALDELGLRGDLMEVHDALNKVRANLFPDKTNEEWLPAGDPIPARAPMETVDMSDVLWPSIPNQLATGDAKTINKSVTRIGNLLWAGADMTLGPMDVTPFPVLLNRLVEADIPFRISSWLKAAALIRASRLCRNHDGTDKCTKQANQIRAGRTTSSCSFRTRCTPAGFFYNGVNWKIKR